MGRVGKKKKMRLIKKILSSFCETRSSWQPYDERGYDELCELDKLISIPNIYVANPDHGYIRDITNHIKNGEGIEREMPDIGGDGFGIEHTEISPFYRHKKKGDSFRRFKRSITESKRIIELESLYIHYLDLPIFFKKLGIQNRSQFKENIVSAIKEKSKKFKTYEHFKHNGLWLDYPPYISFPDSNVLAYFLQDEVYDALLESPYEFFILGNANAVIFVSKDLLKQVKAELQPSNHFFFENYSQKKFSVLDVVIKKAQRIGIDAYAQNLLPFVLEDMCIYHIPRIQISLPDKDESPVTASLYCDDLPATITSWNKVNGVFSVTYVCDGIEGQLETDFQFDLRFSFAGVPFHEGETMSLHVSQHNAKNKQKVMTGIKRLILDYGNSVEIYTTSPHEQVKLGSIIKTGELTESVAG
ncbi:TPA: hypothetical protein NJ338_003233 [Vibrio parahaemolyticus]|nr:hypothetical protein [Vibrio parahaemolyticus]